MSNGIASIPALGSARALPRPAAAILLAALIASIGGCNANTAPTRVPQAVVDTREDRPPSLRYQLDPARNRVWSLTSEGVFRHEVGTPGKIVEIALPSWNWVDAPYSCPPDLALGPNGEAVVTSNVVPMLWRIDPDTLAVSVHEVVLDTDNDKDVGFSGLAYSTEHGVFFAVSDVHDSLWRIDALLSRGQKIALSAPVREACGITASTHFAVGSTQIPGASKAFRPSSASYERN